MRTFTMYRRNVPETHTPGIHAAPADAPQFQGVIFDNGQCAIRWLLPGGSVSVWDSFEDMMAVHGHPEYDSELVWTGQKGSSS